MSGSVQACRRDQRVRELLRLPKVIRREDGSREMFEAVFAGMDLVDGSTLQVTKHQP